MSKNFLIGDCHFGHNGITDKFRTEFANICEHDNTIHENIMSCSGKNNHLYMLGDIFFKQVEFNRLIDYANGFATVNVIMGNHDHKNLSKYASNFDNVKCFGIIKKWKLWLSHAPIHPQELYRGLNVHGHVHKNTVPDPRYFNVSCENIGYKPISLQDVREIFNERNQEFNFKD